MASRMDVKANAVARAQRLIEGAATHFTPATPIDLLGSALSPAEITARLQTVVSTRADVEASKAAMKAKLAAEDAGMPALLAFMTAVEAHVRAAYGNAPDVLAHFGIEPKTRAPLTVEAKVTAAAKRLATRAARHTLGPRQRKAIKGNVTGVVVTPVTEPASGSEPATG